MTTSNVADGRTPRRPSTPSIGNMAARWSASGRGRRRPAAMPAARLVTPGFRARRISGELENRPETGRLIPKLGNLDTWCPTLCGDDRIVNANRIKCLDGRDNPAATPHMGREQRELVLEAATAIEVVCKRCGLARYETQAKLIAEPRFRNLYLDEVEYSLCCSDRFCRGGVRISLTHDDRNEGFVGGMA